MLRNEIIEGDWYDIGPTLPPESVDLTFTSPPFWGKRSYKGVKARIWGGDPNCEHPHWFESYCPTKNGMQGSTETKKWASLVEEGKPGKSYFCTVCYAWRGCLGLEPMPEMYIDHLEAGFQIVNRMTTEPGLLFVDMGDTYAGSGKGAWLNKSDQRENYVPSPGDPETRLKIPHGLKRKDLVGIPWMLAFALRKAGWYWRGEIIWEKPNAKPAGGNAGKPHVSHEVILMFSKGPDHYYAGDLVYQGTQALRSVWRIQTKNYRTAAGKHFAAFPEELARRVISMGCPEDGTVLDPFAGTFTVAAVAKKMGRDFIACELSPDYCEIGKDRLASVPMEAQTWR